MAASPLPEARLGNIVISLYNTGVSDGPQPAQAAHLDGYKPARASTMPQAVQSEFDYALYVAQQGGIHRKSKPLKGFGGAGVVEIVNDYRSDTYRCIYTVRIAGSVMYCMSFKRNPRKDVKRRRPKSS
jgi:phage-related protein